MDPFKATVSDIISAAITAPSGDNVQHWRFVIYDHTIRVLLIPQESVYGPLAFHLGMGALIENIIIAADHYGFSAQTTLFPNSKNLLHIADISLIPDSTDHNIDLFKFFPERQTNRYTYRSVPLSHNAIDTLTGLMNVPQNARVVCISNPSLIQKLGQIVSKQAVFLFSHRELNREFYKSIHWNNDTPIGLPASTLGLPALELFFFRYVLRYWSILALLRFFGVPYLAAKLESSRHSKAGAYFTYIVPTSTINPTTEVIAGQLFEQFWLKATKLGLSVQPSGAVLLLGDAVTAKTFVVDKKQLRLIGEVTSQISELVGATKDESVLWVMRVGLSSTYPPNKSGRGTPDIIFE